MKKVQFTIDAETARLLESLAESRGGNRSLIVREAVRRMAEQEGFEEYLDWLEQRPGIRVSLDRGRADIRAGRTVAHEQVLRRARRSARR